MNNNKYYISIEILQSEGIDFSKDYFELTHSELSKVCDRVKKDNYRYSGNLGRSISLNYYYKLQRLISKM